MSIAPEIETDDFYFISRRPMSLDEFLSLPDDPVYDRQLVDGELWEQDMTVRSRNHATTTAWISTRLNIALSEHGIDAVVADGEAGVILPGRETAVGIDVVVMKQADMDRSASLDTTLMEGIPLLVVEVHSPRDQQRDIVDKTDEYLAAGVPLVWNVDPIRRTVTAHSPGQPLRFFANDDVVDASPAFDGFSLPVQKLFER